MFLVAKQRNSTERGHRRDYSSVYDPGLNCSLTTPKCSSPSCATPICNTPSAVFFSTKGKPRWWLPWLVVASLGTQLPPPPPVTADPRTQVCMQVLQCSGTTNQFSSHGWLTPVMALQHLSGELFSEKSEGIYYLIIWAFHFSHLIFSPINLMWGISAVHWGVWKTRTK